MEKAKLILNIEKIHTTDLGIERIKKNLCIKDDVITWCKAKILNTNSTVIRNGKNWYVNIDNYIITINIYSFTIITAHKIKQTYNIN